MWREKEDWIQNEVYGLAAVKVPSGNREETSAGEGEFFAEWLYLSVWQGGAAATSQFMTRVLSVLTAALCGCYPRLTCVKTEILDSWVSCPTSNTQSPSCLARLQSQLSFCCYLTAAQRPGGEGGRRCCVLRRRQG